MPTDIERLAAEVAALRAIVERPRKRKDRRAMLCFRADSDELAAIDAAAVARGLCRADLIRLGLNAVCGTELRIARDIPAGLRGRRNRKKLDRFSDEKTSVPLRDASAVRHLAARAYSAQVEYQAAVADQAGAVAMRVRDSGVGMADSASGLLSEKLSR